MAPHRKKALGDYAGRLSSMNCRVNRPIAGCVSVWWAPYRREPLLIHSWNIQAGAGTRAERILRAIGEHGADTLVLGETTHTRLPALRSGLRDLGFTKVESVTPPSGDRGVLIASKHPFDRRETFSAVADSPHRWREVWFPRSKFLLAGVYFPHDAPRLKALWPRVLAAADSRRGEQYLLVGDLNSGQTAFDAEAGDLASDPWFTAMPFHGMTDLWRHRNRDTREYTWLSPGRSGRRVGFRIDHAFGSTSLRRRVRKVWYSQLPPSRRLWCSTGSATCRRGRLSRSAGRVYRSK